MNFGLGYVCGVLCGKGYLDKYRISLETKDIELAKSFQKMLHEIVKKEPKIRQYERFYRKKYITYIVSVYGKAIVSDLKKTLKESGTHTWRAPRDAFIDSLFRKGFLQGYFDSEGYIRISGDKKRANIRVTSINQNGLEDIRSLLRLEGIESMIYPSGRYFVLDVQGKTRLTLFKDRIDFLLASKRDRLTKSLSYG